MNPTKSLSLFNYLIAFVFVSVPFFTYCQDDGNQDGGSESGLSYGVKLGAVTSSFSSSQPHTGYNLGFTVGGFADFSLNEKITIHADVAYFQQGGSYVQIIDDTRFGAEEGFLTRNVKDARVILHNIYIPIQAKFTPLSDKPFLKLLVGPYVDINLEATESYQRTGELQDGIYSTATGEDVVTDQYEMLQIGAAAGFQLELPFQGNSNLIVGVSYKYGITPVREYYSYIDFNEVQAEVTSNALAITLGIKL